MSETAFDIDGGDSRKFEFGDSAHTPETECGGESGESTEVFGEEGSSELIDFSEKGCTDRSGDRWEDSTEAREDGEIILDLTGTTRHSGDEEIPAEATEPSRRSKED